jgi:di/tripeptidase
MANSIIKDVLEANPPYSAKVTFNAKKGGEGWSMKEHPKWLEDAVSEASYTFYGKEAAFIGEGGSIPLMNMLSKKFPEADFIVTGVLGPHSNAHGPNEFIDIPMAKKLTACISFILAEQYK